MQIFNICVSFGSAYMRIAALLRLHAIHTILLFLDLYQAESLCLNVFRLSIHHLLNFVAMRRSERGSAHIVRRHAYRTPAHFEGIISTMQTLV